MYFLSLQPDNEDDLQKKVSKFRLLEKDRIEYGMSDAKKALGMNGGEEELQRRSNSKRNKRQ